MRDEERDDVGRRHYGSVNARYTIQPLFVNREGPSLASKNVSKGSAYDKDDGVIASICTVFKRQGS